MNNAKWIVSDIDHNRAYAANTKKEALMILERKIHECAVVCENIYGTIDLKGKTIHHSVESHIKKRAGFGCVNVIETTISDVGQKQMLKVSYLYKIVPLIYEEVIHDE